MFPLCQDEKALQAHVSPGVKIASIESCWVSVGQKFTVKSPALCICAIDKNIENNP